MARLAIDKDWELVRRFEARGIDLEQAQACTLRRAAQTLHRWSEGECGDGNDYASWAIERDQTTGKPYQHIYPHTGGMRRKPIRDLEAGALRRVGELCDSLGLYYYHQTDPRGCSLYVGRVPLDDQNYDREGVSCCVD